MTRLHPWRMAMLVALVVSCTWCMTDLIDLSTRANVWLTLALVLTVYVTAFSMGHAIGSGYVQGKSSEGQQ